MRHPILHVTLTAVIAAAVACAGQQPAPSTGTAACEGTRVLTVRNSTRGVLEVYSAARNGANKVLLGEVQPGVTTFQLTTANGPEFIAQRTGTSTIVAATPGVTQVRLRNNAIAFSVTCRR
ncbi:MAG TPA: hypothetical protein VJL28_15825 [Gemmatimonadaceae bacterium]|nr:hypothetical protein [Gemmatimonadaceae bacterium]